MNTLPHCPHCGQYHQSEARFCPETGKSLPDLTDTLRQAALRRLPRSLSIRFWAGTSAAGLLMICVGAFLLARDEGWLDSPDATAEPPRTIIAEVGLTLSPSLTITVTHTLTRTPTDTPTAAVPMMLTRLLYRQPDPFYSDEVRQMQQRLAELGYSEVGEIDGYFGPKTEAAVKHFQSDHDFMADGVVDATVWEALFRASPRDTTLFFATAIATPTDIPTATPTHTPTRTQTPPPTAPPAAAFPPPPPTATMPALECARTNDCARPGGPIRILRVSQQTWKTPDPRPGYPGDRYFWISLEFVGGTGPFRLTGDGMQDFGGAQTFSAANLSSDGRFFWIEFRMIARCNANSPANLFVSDATGRSAGPYGYVVSGQCP